MFKSAFLITTVWIHVYDQSSLNYLSSVESICEGESPAMMRSVLMVSTDTAGRVLGCCIKSCNWFARADHTERFRCQLRVATCRMT